MQYTINHQCGHSRKVQLYGKTVEHKSKIQWLSSQDCPQCWGAKKREEEAKQPITMTLMCNGLDKDASGNLLVQVVLTGNTYPRKDEIKTMGYRWREVTGGVSNLLSVRRSQMAWVKVVPMSEINEAQSIVSEARQLGATIESNIGLLDLAVIQTAVITKSS